MSGWVLTSTGEKPVVLRLEPGFAKTIGRMAQADFILDAPLVSRVHCKLTVSKAGELQVQDTGSTNGTLVNGQRITWATLKAGDVLTIGRVEFTVTRAGRT
jgi:pSer/pThr/pTyr-binding forkhead associated (FHA) protein